MANNAPVKIGKMALGEKEPVSLKRQGKVLLRLWKYLARFKGTLILALLMTITSNSEMGDVYEEIQVETEGEELKIAFNVKYISDVIRAIEDDEFVMHFNSGISPCVIVPAEGTGYTYMVLPVRLNA